MNDYSDVVKYLYDNKDKKYKLFNDKIINTNLKTIGVRVPIIKSLAKRLSNNYEWFLTNAKNNTYEEMLLEGLVISNIKDIDLLHHKINIFINKIDNWAICDMVCCNIKILKKNHDTAISIVKENIGSDNPWKVRFAFIVLLDYLIDINNLDLIFNYCDNINNDFYYVLMAKAWLISECFIKYRDKTLYYLKHNKLDKFTYNKSISKICDSYRVTKEDKFLLKSMKK